MPRDFDIVTSFFQDNGITMNGISIQTNALDGMHVRAERDLHENDIVARIPKNAVLSTRNTAIADLLEELEIAGLLGLTLALMFEKAKGSESPWYEYIISLPKRVDIPLLWSAKEIGWLAGTELGDAIVQDKIALKEDYDSIILPILNNALFTPLEEFTFEEFQNASSVVSSRAFNVDGYHQQSMVPLADM